MSKHYPWLWFDADGTLFDYGRSESIALAQAFQALEVAFRDDYLEIYRRINRELWLALERREIAGADLPVRRFELLREALELRCSPVRMSAAFLECLGERTELIDGAHDVLRALQRTCRIAVVTNGFRAVQRNRLARSPIRECIAEVIISEEVGAAKPKAAFFEAAFERLGNPDRGDVLLIGDSLTSDMQGGADYGLDTCWFNPSGEPRPSAPPITYEIAHLRELLELVSR